MQMQDRDFYLSAMIGCLDAIRSGTTTLVEYMYPNPRHEMGDLILQALKDAGMRALLGRGIADLADYDNFPAATWLPELTEPLPEAMADCARLLKACAEQGEGRLGFCLAPVHMRCVKPETLGLLQEFARQNSCIISMHICETPRDDEIIGQRHGRLAVQWLEEIGFLDSNLLAVHCVNLVDDAIRRFAANDVKVSYNPVSNMYVATGIAPIPQLMEQDVTISLATDGAASNNAQDILECMKGGVLLQRAATRVPNILSGRDAFRMATIDGARAIGLANVIGSLEPGKRADLVIADFLQPKSAPYYDPINTLVFSSSPRVINTVVIDGRVVLEEGRFTMVDEEALVREAQLAGHNLARRSFSAEILKTARAIRGE
jgi:5-methylthioadenosine/S-adenosylhomocysteine deaminase